MSPRWLLLCGALLGFWARAAGAREVPLVVLATTDIHGALRAENTPGSNGGEGSLLRCATLIKQIRANEPNLLLVDSGDLFQGSAESYLSQGTCMVRALDHLQYDAWCLGNHDFDWGVDALNKLLDLCQTPVLAANMQMPPGAGAGLQRIAPYLFRNVDGVRVAIVGLTSPNIPRWHRPGVLDGVTFSDSRTGLQRILPALRQADPDVLILLVHQGLQFNGDDDANEVNGIAARFPEFDLMLGGHLHWVQEGMQLGQVFYAQAGNAAKGIMRVDLRYDTVQRRIKSKTARFLAVSNEVPDDPELAALLAPELDAGRRYMDEVIGEAACDMTASLAPPGLSPVQQLISAAIADAAGADVVLHGLLGTDGLAQGPITVRDAWDLVPYENTVGMACLTSVEIKAIMEEAMDYWGTRHYFGTYGLAYEVRPTAAKGQRVFNLRFANGAPINGRKRLKVAFNSYQLASGGGRFTTLRALVEQPNARLEILPVDTRSAVIAYIRAHTPLCVPAGAQARILRREDP